MNTMMAILLIIAVSLLATMAIIAILLYATGPAWLSKLLYKFAERDLFVTTVEEGTGKWIMKSKMAWRFITSNAATDPYNDWDLTKEKGDPYSLWNAECREAFWIEWIDRKLPGGMRWVGLFPWIYKIYWYNFRWSVLRENKPAPTEDGLVEEPRKLANGKWVASFAKRINYIYLRDAVYYFEIIGAQTKGASEKGSSDKSVGLAVKINIVPTIRVTNPYLALFRVHDWLSSVFDLMRPSIRSWIATVPFEDVIGKYEATEREHDAFLQQTGVPKEVASASGKPANTIVEYIEWSYGVRAKRIAFDDVITPEDYTNAVTKRAEAEQNKIRIETEAKAKANRLEIVARGEAARVTILAKALRDGGDDARLTRTLEAFEEMGKSGNTIIIGGTDPVQILLQTAKQKGSVQ